MTDITELKKVAQEAKELIQSLLSADGIQLMNVLRPTEEDYAKVFIPEAAPVAAEGFAEQWLTPPRRLARADQTEIDVVACLAEQLASENSASREFPGGYRKIAHLLVPGRIWVRFKLLTPGASLGMAHDGLVKLDERWAWFPKPWRILDGDSDAN